MGWARLRELEPSPTQSEPGCRIYVRNLAFAFCFMSVDIVETSSESGAVGHVIVKATVKLRRKISRSKAHYHQDQPSDPDGRTDRKGE